MYGKEYYIFGLYTDSISHAIRKICFMAYFSYFWIKASYVPSQMHFKLWYTLYVNTFKPGVQYITKTCLYNVSLSMFLSRNKKDNYYPCKPHFYIVKVGFTGVYIIFLISAHKHRLWVLVRTGIHNLCFVQKYEKYPSFLSENFHFLVVKCSIYLNRLVS